jgi:hypothetical protein
MKLNDFWFELPQALVDIAADILTKEEKDYSRLLQTSYKVYTS